MSVENEAYKIIEALLKYSEGKGQIYGATRLALTVSALKFISRFVGKELNIVDIDLMIKLSVNDTPRFLPLWARYAIEVSRGLNQRTEIVQQASKRLRIFESNR